MSLLEAAVIGTGFIGPVHVEALRRAGVVVRGILGSTPARSADAARRLGLARAYDDLDELLGDRDVGVVHIATPNRSHADFVRRALAAGKHVLCEKPLALDTAESRDLVARARASGVACGVAYNVRYYPICQEAASRVRKGEIGPIHHVTGSYAQDWLLHASDFNWRVLAEAGGASRAIADIGTHWLDLTRFVTGLEIESLVADLATFHAERESPEGGEMTFQNKLDAPPRTATRVAVTTEDFGSVLVRFRGGARGTFWVSQIAAGRKNRVAFEISGARSSLAWCGESPDELWIGHRDRANESLLRDPALLAPEARAVCSYPGGHNEGFADTFKQLFRSFHGYIAGGLSGPPPFPTFEDGHREIVLTEAILDSARRRTWVKLPREAS
jgi:predicted dehydrogenase